MQLYQPFNKINQFETYNYALYTLFPIFISYHDNNLSKLFAHLLGTHSIHIILSSMHVVVCLRFVT